MIFTAAMMLTIKIGAIWDGIDGALGSGQKGSASVAGAVSVAGAIAQVQGGDAPADAPPQDQIPIADEVDPMNSEQESRIVTNDPTLLTQAEIDLLQQLAERREGLEVREKELEMREGLLQAAEERIQSKIAELQTFQDTIEKLIKTYDDQQVAKIQSLVKIYENMKPKDAARIFEELEIDTLLLVAERMSERKLAPVMAKMNPAKATEITVELSRLRNLPNETINTGG